MLNMNNVAKIAFTCIFTLQLVISIHGLSCYRCRTNDCSHPFCDLSFDTMFNTNNSAGAKLRELVSGFPKCPSKISNKIKSEFRADCSTNEKCGHYEFRMVTHYKKQGEEPSSSAKSIFPILTGGSGSLNSTTHIYGCFPIPKMPDIIAADNICPTYENKTIDVVAPILSSTSTVITHVFTLENSFSSCCQCASNNCNMDAAFHNKSCGNLVSGPPVKTPTIPAAAISIFYKSSYEHHLVLGIATIFRILLNVSIV